MYKMKRLIALVMACLISIPVLAKREIHFAGDWNITRKSNIDTYDRQTKN